MPETLTLDHLRTGYGERIKSLAVRYGLTNVRVFGSLARGEAMENSDIDLLVTRIPGGDAWGIGGFYYDLQEMFPQKEVDVALESGLNPLIKARILNDAVPL